MNISIELQLDGYVLLQAIYLVSATSLHLQFGLLIEERLIYKNKRTITSSPISSVICTGF